MAARAPTACAPPGTFVIWIIHHSAWSQQRADTAVGMRTLIRFVPHGCFLQYVMSVVLSESWRKEKCWAENPVTLHAWKRTPWCLHHLQFSPWETKREERVRVVTARLPKSHFPLILVSLSADFIFLFLILLFNRNGNLERRQVGFNSVF